MHATKRRDLCKMGDDAISRGDAVAGPAKRDTGASKSLIVRLPFPAPEMMPNRKNGKHWTATKKIKDDQKFAATLCTKAALTLSGGGEFGDGYIPLSLVYIQRDKRHRDLDNLLAASKHILDGMAQALGIDDKRFKPILVDAVQRCGDDALIAAVGVAIVSGVSL